jgi:hypothetical protein
LQDAIAKIGVLYPQEITAYAIHRSARAKVFVIILVQLAAGLQANLVQHSRKINHPARFLFRALGISVHARELSRAATYRQNSPEK